MLELRGVTKTFGDHVAVDDVAFTVPDGQMVGFVGGNGAGKTTTMRIVMGVLAPTAGEVRWNGEPITRQQRARIGYMPEERGLYPKQPILDQLVYLGRLHGMTKADATARALGLLDRFGLGDRAKAKVETLSLGNQQRGQIIAAVLGDPMLLVLDEPFSGLDPAAVDEMSDLLREYTAAGVAVLFSSHQLDLVDRLCDSIVVLHQGRVVAHGTSESLRDSAPLRYRLSMTGDTTWLGGLPGISVLAHDASGILLHASEPAVAEDVLAQAVTRGTVHEFARVRPALSDIYREVTIR